MASEALTAGVTTPGATTIARLHMVCGKFCAEVGKGARKCLLLKRFFAFEPQCSIPIKPVGVNALARVVPNRISLILSWLLAGEFDTISTAIPRYIGDRAQDV
jgi:hypothetical protein